MFSLNFVDKLTEDNPVGQLQDLCRARRWQRPAYELEAQTGPQHEVQYTIACSVSECREIGQGRNKKMAKKVAAQNMLAYLRTRQQLDLVPDDDGSDGVIIYSQRMYFLTCQKLFFIFFVIFCR